MAEKKKSKKRVFFGRFLMLLVVAAVVYGIVWFIWLRPTPTHVATDCADAMNTAVQVYNTKKGTTEASSAAQECANAALKAKMYRDTLKVNNDEEGLKTFDAIYQPAKKAVIDIVNCEEIYDTLDPASKAEYDKVFGE